MKRIVVFSDGTWNSPESGPPTNVLRLTRGVQPKAGATAQVVFYDWGVGSDGKKIKGGIAGAGLDKNIQDCYRFIVHNYSPGDKLYFFGFSRGAYTVRSLAGFIRNCGLLERKHADRIPEAFELYRARNRSSHPNAARPLRFRKQYAAADITEIEFVGVWDTVGALGLPRFFLGGRKKHYEFHDTDPSKIVRHARHALSIDENRRDFMPTLWKEKEGVDLQQVWFAGVHADVGGGYKQRGLSDCAAHWIINEAEASGLKFETHLHESLRPNPLAAQGDEFKGIYRARGREVRAIKAPGPLHAGAKRRWEADARGYRKKSKALKRLLASVDGDWSRIELVE